MPGSPLDPRAKGANRLIREGATLTESAEDVLSVLAAASWGASASPAKRAGLPPAPPAGLDAEADRVRRQIEEVLGPAPVEMDELVRQCGAPVQIVLTVLLELELAGRCHRHRATELQPRLRAGIGRTGPVYRVHSCPLRPLASRL